MPHRLCPSKASRDALMKKKGVVAVGVGMKFKNGVSTGREAVIVSVTKKLMVGQVAEADMIPKTVDGAETDVIQSTPFKALTLRPFGTSIKSVFTDRHRPSPAGVSIGHRDITAGTFGCRVFDAKTRERLILSNNHVLANSNEGVAGDAILQPGPYDGGMGEVDTIAELLRFIPVNFGDSGGGSDPTNGCLTALLSLLTGWLGSAKKSSLRASAATDNLVDAALARPIIDGDILDEILNIGSVQGNVPATLNMPIRKTGRTTGLTNGTIIQVDVSVNVQYDEAGTKIATFTDQLMAGAISQGGDSGSAIIDDSNHLVGLLFAGSDQYTIMNRAENVLSALEITV